uniref:RIIa domain-containing protein 1 isoform X1 n=1 Tax=Halichoerus grypus TaxID=9711 RepID=UPI0016596F14|nr:RIIa domain-containing protein 1 isoform X1 [Halichoerus grypus]
METRLPRDACAHTHTARLAGARAHMCTRTRTHRLPGSRACSHTRMHRSLIPWARAVLAGLPPTRTRRRGCLDGGILRFSIPASPGLGQSARLSQKKRKRADFFWKEAMSEGTPADLGTLWGSGLILRNDVCPCLCLPPSPGPPRPCSTLMPKALPRRHEVSLSELRSPHRDASPAGTSCPCHSQTSHPQSHKSAWVPPAYFATHLVSRVCPHASQPAKFSLYVLPHEQVAPYKGHICSANRCLPSLQVEEMNASLARKRGVRRRGELPGDERSPTPRADEGRTWGAGRGLSARVVRRLDDLDKMATLQGGLLGPDPGALSPAQQEQLRNFKIQTRIANEKYLRTHKEVELLISGFFRLCIIGPLCSRLLSAPARHPSQMEPLIIPLTFPLTLPGGPDTPGGGPDSSGPWVYKEKCF